MQQRACVILMGLKIENGCEASNAQGLVKLSVVNPNLGQHLRDPDGSVVISCFIIIVIILDLCMRL